LKIAESLRSMECFGHFSDAQLERLASCSARVRYPATVTVVKEGDPTRDAYLVEKGTIRIQRETPYGKFTLATLAAGDLFGEASFVDAHGRSGDAFAETSAELLVLNPVAVAAVTEKDRGLAIALHWTIWKSLSKKLRLTNEKLTRFFGQGGAPAGRREPPTPGPPGEFRIDLAAKRILFQEQKLSSMEINFLTSLSRERKIAPGEVLFREGDAGDSMYVVLDGRVMISKFIPGAGEEALAFLDRGDYFGEMALIDNQPRSADAKAHEVGAVVLRIPRDVVEGLLDPNKVSSLRLLRLLASLVAKRLRELDDKIVGWYILAGGSGSLPSGVQPS
jgi:CRP-like cAMP-binding protein